MKILNKGKNLLIELDDVKLEISLKKLKIILIVFNICLKQSNKESNSSVLTCEDVAAVSLQRQKQKSCKYCIAVQL